MHRTYSMRQARAPTASQVQNPPPPSSSTKSGRFFGKASLGECLYFFVAVESDDVRRHFLVPLSLTDVCLCDTMRSLHRSRSWYLRAFCGEGNSGDVRMSSHSLSVSYIVSLSTNNVFGIARLLIAIGSHMIFAHRTSLFYCHRNDVAG